MSTTRTLISTIALAILLSGTIPGHGSSALAERSPESIPVRTYPLAIAGETSPTPLHSVELDGATVYYESAGQIIDVIWGLGRYDGADLELPHVNIRMQYREACSVAGSMWVANDGEYWIKVCAGRLTLLHELGHIWDRHNLTAEQRRTLTELRGLQTWRHETWALAAGEHLAEVMAWALNTEYRLPLRIDNHSEYELNRMYQEATGTDAPILNGREPKAPITISPEDQFLDHGDDLGAGDTMG